MFVVAGVSGNTGKVVANGLLDAGKKVRVIVRDAAKGAAFKARGAEVAVAEISNVEAFTKALEGCEAGYFLCPGPQVADGFKAAQRNVADALLKAITDSKLPRVVLLSSVGADQDSGTGPIDALGYLERKLSAMPINATFLRAAYFQENWAQILGAANAQNIVPTFLKPDFSFPQIATADIGRFAVEALLHPPAKTTAWNLAGPKDYNANDATAALSKALGKPLSAVYIPAANAAGALQQSGLPADVAGVYAEMYQSIDSGKIAFKENLPLKRGTVTIDETINAIAKNPASH
jgi:uncharacterized protein YbjT (DUF2867 family)